MLCWQHHGNYTDNLIHFVKRVFSTLGILYRVHGTNHTYIQAFHKHRIGNTSETFSKTHLGVRPGRGLIITIFLLWIIPPGAYQGLCTNPPLVVANPPLYLWWIIGIAILNRISHMVTDKFLLTTLLLKPFIFTDNLCSL